jgi:hypothetical protein
MQKLKQFFQSLYHSLSFQMNFIPYYTLPTFDELFLTGTLYENDAFVKREMLSYIEHMESWMQAQPRDSIEQQNNLLLMIREYMYDVQAHAFVRFYHAVNGKWPCIMAYADAIHGTKYDIKREWVSDLKYAIARQVPTIWPECLQHNSVEQGAALHELYTHTNNIICRIQGEIDLRTFLTALTKHSVIELR